jgi:hypothetical protein
LKKIQDAKSAKIETVLSKEGCAGIIQPKSVVNAGEISIKLVGVIAMINEISLRDYFAGLSMQAFLENGNYINVACEQAYITADTMLAERDKKDET